MTVCLLSYVLQRIQIAPYLPEHKYCVRRGVSLLVILATNSDTISRTLFCVQAVKNTLNNLVDI